MHAFIHAMFSLINENTIQYDLTGSFLDIRHVPLEKVVGPIYT